MRRLLWLLSDFRVDGRGNVPLEGPLLVVSNHLNNTDPIVLGAVLPRRVVFMAKVELFRVPVFGRMVKAYGAFPVRRFEADLKALRVSSNVLASGLALGMFPEGHRSRTGGLLRAHPGTALVALRSGALILPVAITGTENLRSPWAILRRRPRVRVVVGTPFRLGEPGPARGEAVAAGTDRIMREIAALLPASYRGVYTETEAPVASAAGPGNS
jgi:1-acyl-sn-glycerol-3-phosphate acyltransferase